PPRPRAATRALPPASAPPCPSPAPAVGPCTAACPSSPSPPRHGHQNSEPPPAPTKMPSTTCSPGQDWPPEPHQIQDLQLDSIFPASPTQAGLGFHQHGGGGTASPTRRTRSASSS